MSHSRREQVLGVVERLAPLLQQMESERLDILGREAKSHRAMWVASFCWMALCVVLLLAEVAGMLAIVMPAIGFVISVFVIYGIYVGGRKAAYVTRYKAKVLTAVTKEVQPKMNFRPHEGISKALFKSSGIDSSRIDRYQSEDLFLGEVGETEVYFSEVKAERKDTSRDSDGKTKTTWHTVFDGIFFMADFHKEFDTWVTVMPDFAEKSFGWFGKKLQNFGGNVVRLENPEFEQAFVVRGGDQVAARYILTPDMQERLLELRRFHGTSVKLAFKDSRVILTFDSRDNWFEPDFHKPSNDLRQIEGFVMELQSCCAIVEILNLNTRIWTKT